MNADARQAMSRTAIWRLALATTAWGLSFCVAKAAMQIQQAAAPGLPGWFHASLLLFNRMGLAVLVMLCLLRGRAFQLTRLEFRQGLELGLFGGVGMLLQTDAQNHIDASTSAFFTQFTSVFVPIVVALRSRRLPPLVVFISCFLVLAGCMILSGVDLRKIALRRGEWETILSALAFTGQILCLERPRFFPNDAMRTATVMFAVKGALLLPLVLAGGGVAAAWQASSSWAALALTGILTLACTVYAYVAMTRWQPFVTATQAGIIYATEPIFAAAWAFMLPGWISALTGIHYANEELHRPLFIGGALILLANALLILRPGQRPHGDPAPMT
jgi:drug/metabolite transporter (DMT)-like permease